MSGSSEVKLGDSVLVVDDNNLVGVGKLSLKASASTATFFDRGLVSKYRLDSLSYFESNILGEKQAASLSYKLISVLSYSTVAIVT